MKDKVKNKAFKVINFIWETSICFAVIWSLIIGIAMTKAMPEIGIIIVIISMLMTISINRRR